MFIVHAFRSSKTVRITLPHPVRHALKIEPGDHIMLREARAGVVEMTNATAALTPEEPKRKLK